LIHYGVGDIALKFSSLETAAQIDKLYIRLQQKLLWRLFVLFLLFHHGVSLYINM